MVFRNSLICASATLCILAPAYAQDVTLITPYLTQPGTQAYVESFSERADEYGWTVNIVHTDGDLEAVVEEMENAVEQGIEAIVVNIDPTQIEKGLQTAANQKIPVVGLDAGNHPLLSANITSNGYEMGASTAGYIANRIGGSGNVVMFTYDSFPPVRVRSQIADTVFGSYPDISVVERITPEISDGAISDSRTKMDEILAIYPEPGSISAVWAAWDQPALGALQAIEAAGRSNEGIIITGIDANPQAIMAIADGSNLEATVAQDFHAIGQRTADTVAKLLSAEVLDQRVIYVPSKLVTAEDLQH